MKKFEYLTIVDDFMFCKVMTLEPDICRHLLEIILDVKIKEVHIIEAQKTIETTFGARGIRLDVYLEDEANTVYDIEMQTVLHRDLPKRSRYYQGMIDMNLIERGDSFNKLRNSFIIFICTFDPFGSNLPVYHFRNRCDEQTNIVLNDGTEKVFVNVTAWSNVKQEELKALLRYFESGIITDTYTEKIEESVTNVRNGEKWRTEYMTFEMKLQEVREDAYEEGKIEGREEGREEGLKEGKIELIAGLVKNKLITLSDAAKQMDMTEDELRKIIKR